VTLAKGLANGLPIGALLVADTVAGAFVPGDHGSTFGGNPVACAAACAVCQTVDDELLADVRDKGAWLVDRLCALPSVADVRGAGLLLGVELAGREPSEVIDACREKRLLVGAAGEGTLRITPALTITRDELGRALAILEEVLV
jgi:acetylornithine/N-succinyldiaminopimelate aminotransferase